LISYLIII